MPQLEQLAVNARRAPEWILTTHSANQFSYVLRHRRPPRSTATYLPGPEQTKALAVPSNDGVWFDDDQRALESAKLVPECQVLRLEQGSRFEGGRHGRSQRVKRG